MVRVSAVPTQDLALDLFQQAEHMESPQNEDVAANSSAIFEKTGDT